MMIDPISLVVGIVSAITAVISVAFAWRAVKVAERSSNAALLVELHQLYHSDTTFRATQKVWEIYNNYQSNADGTPITPQQALEFVKNSDRNSLEWKAVHDASSFWRYVALLVKQGYLDEGIAFKAFSSPRILGLLYPIEETFLQNHKMSYDYDESLKYLYDHWKSRQVTRT